MREELYEVLENLANHPPDFNEDVRRKEIEWLPDGAIKNAARPA
jgi:hypothetical protein